MKTALVTGASQGIGFEVCKQLLDKGFSVFLSARDQKRGEKAVAELSNQKNKIQFLLMDVADEASVKQAAALFGTETASLDVLVNNAGIYPKPPELTILDTPVDLFQQTFLTNTVGAVFVTRAFLPYLEKGKSSRVINVSSGAGVLTHMESFAAPYSISKTALNAVTRQSAAVLKSKSIAVNSICPGWVRTEMGGKDAPLSVEEGADSILWLATEAPSSLTGQFIRERQKIEW